MQPMINTEDDYYKKKKKGVTTCDSNYRKEKPWAGFSTFPEVFPLAQTVIIKKV